MYNLGGIKIEEASKELRKRGLLIEGAVAMAVSHFCLRHLADSVGTFTQMFDSLQPKTGLLPMDGFFFLTQEDSSWQTYQNSTSTPDLNMFLLLNNVSAPFLMWNFSGAGSLNHVILKRPDQNPCQLTLRYHKVLPRTGRVGDLGSQYVIQFKMGSKSSVNKAEELGINFSTPKLYENKSLFVWLKKNNLLHRSKNWIDIDEGTYKKSSALHRCIVDGDSIQTIQKMIESGDFDVNSRNPAGYTLLHLAVKQQRLDIVKLLLQHRASPNSTNFEGYTPLHTAVETDHADAFVALLLDNKADATVVDKTGDTPLDLAMRLNEKNTVEILRKATT